MPTIVIRPVTLADTEGLRDCVGAIAQEGIHLAFTEPFTLTETALYVARNIDAGHPHFVAAVGRSIVGFCDVTPKAGGVYRHVGVLGLGVAATFRARGVGTRLLAAGAKAALRRWEQVELSVYATNTAAQSLYRKAGFVERGRLPLGRKAAGRYDDVILMTLLPEPLP